MGNAQFYRETLFSFYEQGFRIDKILVERKTAEQHLILFHNEVFGNVLALDGNIQTTEKDEFIYHELMVHPALFLHPNPKRVLVVGGGDGGSLRECLKHTNLEKITLCEIDAEVVAFSKQFLPQHSAGAFENQKIEVVIADALAYVHNFQGHFDVIINDATDPVGPGLSLYREDFYRDCARLLGKEGIMVGHSGVFQLQRDHALSNQMKLRKVFHQVHCYSGTIPTYIGGEMLFHLASQTDYSHQQNFTAPRLEIMAKTHLQYVNSVLLDKLFALPEFIRRPLAEL